MSLFHLLFGFSGRANRGKFWLAVVLWIVFWAIAVPACVLAAIIILGLHLPDSSLPHDELIGRYVRLAFDYLGLLIVFIAFTIRELDFGIRRRRQATARSRQERMVGPFVLSRAVGSRQHREHQRATAGRVCPRAGLFRHLDLGAGRAWFPARDRRSQPIWARSAATARRRFRRACICRPLKLRLRTGTRPCSRARRQHATSRDQNPPRLRNFCTRLPCTSAE
jgi:hypothetical protein